jgi:hypothetical protein
MKFNYGTGIKLIVWTQNSSTPFTVTIQLERNLANLTTILDYLTEDQLYNMRILYKGNDPLKTKQMEIWAKQIRKCFITTV